MKYRKMRAVVCLLALLVCAVAAPVAQAGKSDGQKLAKEVARVYGLKQWDKVAEVKYTFRVKTETRDVARHWTWRPKDDLVTLEEEGKPTIMYKRSELNENTSEDVITADKRFINDSYWFLFPFQLVWSNPSFTDEGMTKLPMGEGEGRKLIVQYPDEGGYTPGDAYDIYLDEDHMITHWVFRRGGGDEGGAMTWEANKQLGPIKVCTDHHNPEGTFRLFFDGISLTTVDGKMYEPE